MDYLEFQREICNKISLVLGTTHKLRLGSTTKNNGVELVSLSIMKGDHNIAPCIYLEDYFAMYTRGEALGDIVKNIITVYEGAKLENPMDMGFFIEFEKVVGKITFKLINFEKNKKLLETVPHKKFLNLAVIFYVLIQNKDFENASITINNQHCVMWKTNSDVLYEIAKSNSMILQPAEVKTMREVMEELMGGKLPQDLEEFDELRDDFLDNRNDTEMLVLSNTNKFNGAVGMLDDHILMELSQEYDSDLFLLPSSVHELIIIPNQLKNQAETFATMVRDVNDTQVSEEEFLSNNVYFYDKMTREISIVA